MGKKKLSLGNKKLSLKTETVRKLIDNELDQAVGGAYTYQYARCSTGSINKCYGNNDLAITCK